jgi:hypothetical protein
MTYSRGGGCNGCKTTLVVLGVAQCRIHLITVISNSRPKILTLRPYTARLTPLNRRQLLPTPVGFE